MQKKTRISLGKMSGRFWRRRLIFRRATHWISGAEETRVTGEERERKAGQSNERQGNGTKRTDLMEEPSFG